MLEYARIRKYQGFGIGSALTEDLLLKIDSIYSTRKRFDMRETFHIISDGSCDLPPALAQARNITVVPFYVSFDDQRYLKENEEISIRDFYQQMVFGTSG